MLLRHFRGPLLFTMVCFVLAAWYGLVSGGSLLAALEVLWIVMVLAVLEISLSFDNAVVNATVLQGMDELWRQRFLTWGMVISVYGMFVVFPLAIVAVAAGIGPIEAFRLSLSNPSAYEAIMHQAHTGIAGFGGAFLLLVGLKFFFDADKEIHWIALVEARLVRLATLPAAEAGVVLTVLCAISFTLPAPASGTYLIAGLMGMVIFLAVESLGQWLQRREARITLSGGVVRSGLGGFIYLNVLDASFSFDGVIGAFALSNSMVVIALGLSVGAMFVRSLTLLLVRQGTLAEYHFLEHGAFWAIIALGIIMLISVRWDVPETVTGLIGAVLIAASLGWSIRHNRQAPVSRP